MAAAVKASGTASVTIPECPVCLENMKAPIFLCLSGHSLCASCTSALVPANCPICRQAMTQMRNRSLEDIINKAKVSCPNKQAGCVYALSSAAVEEHLKECIFRQMVCPFGEIFGKCSWTGQLQQMLEHFRQKHPQAVGNGADSEVEFDNVTLKECDRRMALAYSNKLLFIITLKIDSLQRLAFWTVQHIGPKKQAHQFISEIHVICKRDTQRKVIFTEHCFSDTVRVDDITKDLNCAVMPLDMLAHFLKDNKLLFRYNVRRITDSKPPPKPTEDKKPGAGLMPPPSSKPPPNGPRPRSPSQNRGAPNPRGGHGKKGRGGKA